MDLESRDKDVLRAPFAYPGGKSKSVKHILPQLPYTKAYIEVFGGSGAVLLARQKSKLEVYNDRYSGVVAFYRCLADDDKWADLRDRCEMTIHSREEFVFCKATWDQNHLTDVERAYRWYYMVCYSFGSLARNWGRSTKPGTCFAGKMRERLIEFMPLHTRLKKVQIENLDWRRCLSDYNFPDATYYLDPPYLEVSQGIYKTGGFGYQDHIDLLETVMDMDAFVAISSYENSLYQSYKWDKIIKWEANITIQSVGCVDNNKHNDSERGTRVEVLYIKEAN